MSKGMAAALIACVLGGFIGGGVLCYGLMTFIPTPGQIIQTQIVSVDSQAFIQDSTTSTYQGIPDTYKTVTTLGNSYLIIRYTAPHILHLAATFSSALTFNISIELNGEKVIEGRSYYYLGTAYGDIIELSESFTLEFKTGTLPAGSYTVNMTWISVVDRTGANQLLASTVGTPMLRTLMIQEIHV